MVCARVVRLVCLRLKRHNLRKEHVLTASAELLVARRERTEGTEPVRDFRAMAGEPVIGLYIKSGADLSLILLRPVIQTLGHVPSGSHSP